MSQKEKPYSEEKDNPARCLENPTAETTELNLDLPRGRTRSWSSVFGAFIALFCTFGQMNAFGTFQAWYATHQLQHLSPETISWIGSLQLWVFFFSGAPIGRAFDTCGPTPIMALGTLLFVFSIMMTSISTHYYQYILFQGILFGLGVGMMFYPSMAAVSTHFSRYRATSLGIVAAGSSLGGALFPILLQHLFMKIGFSWTVRVTGLISAVGCVIATTTVSSGRLAAGHVPRPWIDIKTLRDTRFMLLAAGSALIAFGIFIPPLYIIEVAHTSVYVLVALNAGGVVGRLVPALLADAVGRFNVLAPSAFLAGFTCVALWSVARTLSILLVFASAYGFFAGAFIAVVNPCVVQISDTGAVGTRIGMLYSLISFPALLGGPVAGALFAMDGEKNTSLIVFSGTTVILGSFLILWVKLDIDRNIFARV